MKNIFKYSILATIIVAMSGLTACQQEELDTDQYAGKLALAAIAPNPVMRGAQLRVIGANLDKVTEVRFAGGATVTSIEKVAAGERSEIRLTVPMDAAVGPVTVVTSDGLTASTRFDLEYTEPIVFSSFAPATVLSGDVVTIKGEYLNNVREVILGGGVYVTEFNSQSGSELSFTVPANAVSGYVIIGDVNEIEDQNTIPNQIYSGTELVVGDPTVAVADTATYKSGDVIKVTGEHLDMIEKIDLTGASEVEFTVAEDCKSISFNLPPTATDGQVKLTSYAGKEFEAGFVQTLSVVDLAIASIAEDGRYKAGSDVKITGSDLDLVTKVEFTGAEAQWYLDGEDIVATIPADAKDGGVTVTLGSGKQAYTEAIEVVKPVATWISGREAVAGGQQIAVAGTDLDLVTSVTIGDKDNGLIKCGFTVSSADTVRVIIPRDAYTGVLTLAAANGDATQTDEITVTYNEAVSIVFDEPSYALGRKVTISGSNLMKVETINIKGKKVISFSERKNDAMAFDLPDGVGPGVYKLDLGLIDGSELTWAVPFEVTAPYTETFVWEGSRETGSYANNLELGGEDDWVNNGLAVGDVVRVYFTAADPADWSMQLFTGHWSGMSMLFPDLQNPNQFNQDRNPDAIANGYVAFEVTEEIFNLFTEKQGWGSALIVQGKFLTVTGISFLHFGVTETVVWEGDAEISGWTNYDNLGPENLFLEAGIAEGMTLHFYFTAPEGDWQFKVYDGHWGGMSFAEIGGGQEFNVWNYTMEDNRISVAVTSEMAARLTQIQGWGSFIIVQGAGGMHLTKITIE